MVIGNNSPPTSDSHMVTLLVPGTFTAKYPSAPVFPLGTLRGPSSPIAPGAMLDGAGTRHDHRPLPA